MNPKHYRAVIFLILATLLSGCFSPGAVSLPAAVDALASSDPTATPTFYQPPADSTATPTPFQPIPPTAVFYPTATPEATATPLPTATPKSQSNNSKGPFVQPEGQVNILLLGSDQRPGGRIFRTDTIVLVTLNPDLGSVHLTSFPRDLYITIPGYGVDRINTAWQRGGFEMVQKTFQYNFGVPVDHYVLINFQSFKRLVDSLGGLDVNVGQSLTDYRYGYGYLTIKPGVHHMDADMVLWYVRSRKTTNDFARTRRQQEALEAILDKMLSLNAIKRAPEFYDLYKDNVTTDLGFTDMVPYIPMAAQLADRSNLKQYFIGPKQVYDWITPGGAMVLMPRMDEIKAVLRKALNIP